MRFDLRMAAELAYCVPLGIPHSTFLGWDPDDQDKATAWLIEQQQTCKGCGTREDEWEADRFAFVGQQRHCAGCDLLEQEQENVPDGVKGVSVYLVPAAQARSPEQEGVET